MRIIRLLASAALWVGVLLGLAAGGVWMASRLGHVQSMVVISGSMEPGIMTGDLLIDRPIATDQVEIGDILSLPSSHTGHLVTHRVIDITRTGDQWEVRMQGDANSDPDMEPYIVGDRVMTPWIRVPQGGKVVSKVMEPAVAMPILLALVALLGLSLLDEPKRQVVRRVISRAARRDPRVAELDDAMAAVGIDVERLQGMNDLDLQLYSLGIELADEPDVQAEDEPSQASDDAADDSHTKVRPAGHLVEHEHDDPWEFRLPVSDAIHHVRMSSIVHSVHDLDDLDDLDVTGDFTVTGDLTVTGDIGTGDLTVTGDIDIIDGVDVVVFVESDALTDDPTATPDRRVPTLTG